MRTVIASCFVALIKHMARFASVGSVAAGISEVSPYLQPILQLKAFVLTWKNHKWGVLCSDSGEARVELW
jgi:hypothetical protein